MPNDELKRKPSRDTGGLILILVFAIVYHGFYWFELLITEGLSTDVLLLTRATDPVYFYFFGDGVISPFSGETFAPDDHGVSTGSIRLPFLLLLPEILAYQTMGIFGPMIIDLALFTGRLLVLFWLLNAFGLRRVIAFGITLSATIWTGWADLIGVQYAGSLFQDRLLRPNITAVIFILSLLSAIAILRCTEISYKLRYSALLAFCTSLLLISNVHAAQIILILAAVLHIPFSKAQVPIKLRMGLTYAMVVLLASVPLIAQFITGSSDQVERLGFLEVHSQFEAIASYILRLTYWFAAPTLTVFGIGVFLVCSKHLRLAEFKAQQRAMTLFLLVFAAIVVAFPIATLIVGKTIQPRHYLYEMALCFDLMLCFVVGLIVQCGVERHIFTRPYKAVRRFRGPVYLLIFVISTCALLAVKPHNIDFSGARSDTGKLQTLVDFDGVKSFLAESEFDGVLATNSAMLGAWWAGPNNGLLLMPHAGASTLSDQGLAVGVARFGRLMKMSGDEYEEMLALNSFQDLFVGHFKHVWTKFTHVGEKYDTEKEPHSDIFAKGPLILPIEDQQMFEEVFKSQKSFDAENHLIVVLKSEFFKPSMLVRTTTIYENESYVIKLAK